MRGTAGRSQFPDLLPGFEQPDGDDGVGLCVVIEAAVEPGQEERDVHRGEVSIGRELRVRAAAGSLHERLEVEFLLERHDGGQRDGLVEAAEGLAKEQHPPDGEVARQLREHRAEVGHRAAQVGGPEPHQLFDRTLNRIDRRRLDALQ